MTAIVPNLRDLGGLRAADGRTVRPGLVLRSALPHPQDLPAHGVVWPPSLVIDLRSPAETGDRHPLQDAAAAVQNVPLLSALAPGVAPPATLPELYRHVIDTVPDRLASVVAMIAEADGPALVHCAAGKDRTGIVVALTLRLLGVDREQVVADYLRTEQHGAQIRARLAAAPGRAFSRPVPPHFLEVPVEAIEVVLDRWDAHRHGVEGWVRDAGVDADVLEALRGRLLAPVARGAQRLLEEAP